MPNKKISELTDAGTISTSDEIPLARAGKTYKAKIGLSIVPVGSVVAFAGTNIPEGWLLCDGSAIPNANGTVQGKTANFSSLYSVIGSNVPDLRGYFIRGFGTNSDKTISGNFKEKQTDELKSHTHNIKVPIGTSGGANYYVPPWGGVTPNRNILGVVLESTGRDETRPKNIALHYIIKY